MVKTTFTQWLRLCVCFLITGVTYSSNLIAQCEQMTCNDGVQISVNGECEIVFTEDQLLEGDPTTQGDPFTLTIEALGIDGVVLPTTGLTIPNGTYTFKVVNSCGNSCWGKVVIEDNIPPSLDPDVDYVMPCPVGTPCPYSCAEGDWLIDNDVYTGAEGDNPVFLDNCGDLGDITFNDVVTDTDNCQERLVTRTWTATYVAHGENVSMVLAIQQFLLGQIDPDDIECPVGAINLPCSIESSTPDAIAAYYDSLTPSVLNDGLIYAYPYFLKANDEVLPVLNTLCNIAVGYADTPLNICGDETDAKKILRTWTIIDWCNGTSVNCVQQIKVGGTENPSIKVHATLIQSTDPWTCARNLDVPAPEHINDPCMDYLDYYTVILEGANSQLIGDHINGYTLVGVPKGTYNLIYVAENPCGLQGRDTTLLTIGDFTPPVAIANEHLVVSLTSGAYDAEGVAKVFTNSIDKGSYDSCTGVHLEIRRDSDNCRILGNDTYNNGLHPNDLNIPGPDSIDVDNGLFVKFCCADLDQVDENGVRYGNVKVWLRVWDDGDMDGEYGSEGDNYNETWAFVRVEDKLPASIVAPPDVTITCNEDLSNEKLTGVGTASGNCGTFEDVCYKDSGDISSCGLGVVERVWFIDINGDCEPDNEYFAVQLITIEAIEPFDPTEIKWPPHYKDRSFDGVSIEVINGQVVTTEGSVDMPGTVNCAEDAIQCKPEWNNTDCSIVGESVRTDTFFFEAGSCMTIIKHWIVVDWCRYAPNDDPNDGPFNDLDDENDSGCEQFEAVYNELTPETSCFSNNDTYFRYKRDISIVGLGLDLNDDIMDLGPNSTVQDIRNAINGVLGVGCFLTNYPLTIVLANGATISISPTMTLFDIQAAIAATNSSAIDILIDGMVDVDGYYTFDQIITISDDQKPVFPDCDPDAKPIALATSGTSCATDLVVSTTAIDEGSCGSAWLKYSVDIFDRNWNLIASDYGQGANGDLIVFDASSKYNRQFTEGLYHVTWRVTDGCGNYSTCTQRYQVQDQKPPSPYCYSDLGITVMDQVGYVDIWATDFNLGATDNCTPQDLLVFSFSDTEFMPNLRISCIGGDGDLFLENGVSQVFDDIKVWVWDLGYDENCDGSITIDERNKDFCTVSLTVEDNVGICENVEGDTRALVSGELNTITGDAVVNAEVVLTSNNADNSGVRMSSESGAYAFVNNPMYQDYELTASRDDQHDNGVSTLDLVLIQKHILGSQLLNNPYKVIAADANSDQRITAADIVEIRKVILGVNSEFSRNESWRFVDAAQQFNDDTNPFPFAESIILDGLDRNMTGENFVAVKIGDVNDNAKANNAVSTEVRNNQTANFVIDEQLVDNGALIVVPVTLENADLVHGVQFSMDFNGMTLEGVQEGVLNIKNANYLVGEGSVNLAWADAQGVDADDVLFTMIFKATESLTLSNSLTLNNDLNAEIYTGENIETSNVALDFRTENMAAAGTFALYQNQPNPFKGETSISFSLVESGQATMTVFDVSGKIIHEVVGNYNRGMNTIAISDDNLNQAGILYYTLTAGGQLSTKKMIVIE